MRIYFRNVVEQCGHCGERVDTTHHIFLRSPLGRFRLHLQNQAQRTTVMERTFFSSLPFSHSSGLRGANAAFPPSCVMLLFVTSREDNDLMDIRQARKNINLYVPVSVYAAGVPLV